ncbi:MAG TPA: DUF423 domain-containing protein [Opitutus sp.]|nr:DUF423 domain-containing protein [Opitutus sp.]
MNHRTILLTAGILGATGVALGAFGAHALRDSLLERGMANAWETAVRYHLLHAIALLALGAWQKQTADGDKVLGWTARLWTIGVALFAGSLYGLALGGPRWLGPVTPLGGLAFIAGWIGVIITAVSKRDQG